MSNGASYQIDFPTFLPSFLVKELRQGLRSPYFTWIFTATPIILALSYVSPLMKGSQGTDVGAATWTVLIIALLMVVFRAKAALHDEMESRSIDLLVLSRLNPWLIVWGKWCSYMAQALLVMILMLPFFFVRYYFGNVNLTDDLYLLSYLFIGTGVMTALVMWISGMPTALRVIAFAVIISLVFGGVSAVPLMFMMGSFFSSPDVQLPLGFILFNAAVLVPFFLLLAARWVETPAANSSIPVRLLVVPPFLMCALLALFSGINNNELLMKQLSFSMMFALGVFIVELTMPKKILPVHFANVAKTKFAVFKKLFLMPDFFSASLAFILFIVFATIATLIWAPDYVASQSVWVGFFVLFSVHAPAFFTSLIGQKKQERRIYGLLIYGLLLIPCFIASTLFYASRDSKAFSILVPWGFVRVNDFNAKSDFVGDMILNVFLSGLIAIAGIVVICACSESWRKALEESKKLSYLNNND